MRAVAPDKPRPPTPTLFVFPLSSLPSRPAWTRPCASPALTSPHVRPFLTFSFGTTGDASCEGQARGRDECVLVSAGNASVAIETCSPPSPCPPLLTTYNNTQQAPSLTCTCVQLSDPRPTHLPSCGALHTMHMVDTRCKGVWCGWVGL